MSGFHEDRGIGRTVRAALAHTPDATLDELVAMTGLTRRQCIDQRWAARNRPNRRANGLRWRRRNGERPRQEVNAELRAHAEALAKPVLKLKKRNAGSFSEIGASLGITRNAVAGRLWRAKQREKRAEARA